MRFLSLRNRVAILSQKHQIEISYCTLRNIYRRERIKYRLAKQVYRQAI